MLKILHKYISNSEEKKWSNSLTIWSIFQDMFEFRYVFIFTTRLAKNEKTTSALGAFIELNYT